MKLFFDTETTGKADFRSDHDAPIQPHIVQLAAILTQDDGTERGSINVIIKPDGWTIPDEAASIHGITTEIAEVFGVQLDSALALFSNLIHASDELVAHNIDFDVFVTQCDLLRCRKQPGASVCSDRLGNIRKFCTMKSSTNICKLPGNYGKYKWPKLTEAHKHFFGTEVEGAHDAMVDLRACKRIYFALTK